LFTRNPGLSHQGQRGVDRGVNLQQYVGADSVVASSLSAQYTKAVSTRRDWLLEFERIRQYYMVQAILNALIDDSLTPDAVTGEVLQVVSQNQDLHTELKAFQKSHDLDQLINDIIMDLVSYGEYSVRLKIEEGRGITEIIDDVDQSRIVAFYREGFPYRFIRQTDR